MQHGQILHELCSNPAELKRFYDGYKLIIGDAKNHKHYEAFAEHKKTFEWIRSEIKLRTEDWNTDN